MEVWNVYLGQSLLGILPKKKWNKRDQSWKVEIKKISLWEQSDLDKRRDGNLFKNKKKCAKKEQKPGIPQKLRFINGLVYDDMDFTNCFLSQSVMNKKK